MRIVATQSQALAIALVVAGCTNEPAGPSTLSAPTLGAAVAAANSDNALAVVDEATRTVRLAQSYGSTPSVVTEIAVYTWRGRPR